jgi:hypothetical protein
MPPEAMRRNARVALVVSGLAGFRNQYAARSWFESRSVRRTHGNGQTLDDSGRLAHALGPVGPQWGEGNQTALWRLLSVVWAGTNGSGGCWTHYE